jgi:hypothetical protein
MLKDISRTRLAAIWVAAVIVMAAFSVVWGMALTLNSSAIWLVVCLAPPAVMLLVWRGAPPLTIAELIHSVDVPSKDTRP